MAFKNHQSIKITIIVLVNLVINSNCDNGDKIIDDLNKSGDSEVLEDEVRIALDGMIDINTNLDAKDDFNLTKDESKEDRVYTTELASTVEDQEERREDLEDVLTTPDVTETSNTVPVDNGVYEGVDDVYNHNGYSQVCLFYLYYNIK